MCTFISCGCFHISCGCFHISCGCFHRLALGDCTFRLPQDRGSHHRVHDFERRVHRIVYATKKTDDDSGNAGERRRRHVRVRARRHFTGGEVFLVINLQVSFVDEKILDGGFQIHVLSHQGCCEVLEESETVFLVLVLTGIEIIAENIFIIVVFGCLKAAALGCSSTRAAVRVDARVLAVAAIIESTTVGAVAIGIPRAARAVAAIAGIVETSIARPPGRNRRRRRGGGGGRRRILRRRSRSRSRRRARLTRAAVRVDAHVGVDVAAAIIDRRRGVVAIGIPRAACAVTRR